MILAFFFLSVLLSCPSFLHTTSVCPKSFSCQDFGPFKYPFYNVTDNRRGLIGVNCTSSPENIQFRGQSSEILEKGGSDSSFISNATFEKLVESKTCDALLNNFTSPTPHLFLIRIFPMVTLFKCTKIPNYTALIDAYYEHQPNYTSPSSYKESKLYYNKHPITNTCEVIQLPLNLRGPDNHGKVDEANIFSYFTPFITFFYSPSCVKCYNEGWHHCAYDDTKFQCLNGKQDQRKLILILALSAGVVTMLITIIICYLWKRKPRIQPKNNINVEILLKRHELFLAPKRYSYSQIKKMTNSFRVKLGQGGFGSVYRGELSNGELVAVKILNALKGNGKDFVNEVASVGMTSHVNIVRLVGFCLEGHRRALVYEFMPNGSLERFIYGQGSFNSNNHLGWEKLHQIAIGIAQGLEYLHKGCNTRILHFDIKPHNILLDNDFCPKISDFGLAKLFPDKKSTMPISDMRGTPGYIAPELFSRGFGGVSHKSDVYSYGMMILEMVGGRTNIKVGVDHTSEIYFPHFIYKKIELHEEHLGLHGIVSDEENEIARKMIIVGLWCIQTNPVNRPTITEVLDMLEGDLASLGIPPKPYLTSPSRSFDSTTTF